MTNCRWWYRAPSVAGGGAGAGAGSPSHVSSTMGGGIGSSRLRRVWNPPARPKLLMVLTRKVDLGERREEERRGGEGAREGRGEDRRGEKVEESNLNEYQT